MATASPSLKQQRTPNLRLMSSQRGRRANSLAAMTPPMARHKDVDMTDAPPLADERRRTDSKAADKGAGDGGGEQDEVTRLHVGRLTRNVKEEHVREIFGTFGKLKVSWLVPQSLIDRAALRWHLRWGIFNRCCST